MAKLDIAAETQKLPLSYYISAPLTAAIEAQAMSAHSTIEFIDAVATDEFGKMRTMDFTYETNIVDPASGETTSRDVTLTVPTLAMTEGPHMAIDSLNVAFEFKVGEVISKENQFKITADAGAEFSSETTTSMSGSTGGLAKFLYGDISGSVSNTSTFKAHMNVSTAYQRSERHGIERSATLKMNVAASQRVPEGVQRVLQIFSDAISSQADVAAS